MALVPIFHGRVDKSGALVLFDTERHQRRAYLRTLVDRDVETIVRKKRVKRSLDQNAYWHAVPFALLQEALGYDSVEELKFDLMGDKWGWTLTKAGHRVPLKMHTSELTTAEGSEFTDWLVRFGAMLPTPVWIPLPNEVAA